MLNAPEAVAMASAPLLPAALPFASPARLDGGGAGSAADGGEIMKRG